MRTALFVTLLAACTNAPAPSPDVSATVNGRAIMHAEVERLAHSSHAFGGAVAQKAVLESLISQELAAQRAQDLKLVPDEAGLKEIARAEAELNTVKRRVLSSALYAKEELKAAELSDAEARAYFAAHGDDLRRQTHVLSVMRRSQAELEQMASALTTGTTFEGYAKELIGAPEGQRPWDLGWLSWAQLPAPWREVVRGLKPGEVSPVIRGEHGRFWLLQLVDARQGPALSFEQALPHIKQAVAVERANAARDALDATLREKARIDYAPTTPDPVANLATP
jgi:parvulin-like peptidyl-prolyl isomerase